ncbi:MAG: hypothetical protein GY834_04875 [Bacteroidetes bacterium]|nr:hypothetical protein [Bacteroidota bacterium]
MHTYLIMQNPGHNRVYYEQSAKLALAELKIACVRFKNKCEDIELITLANNVYISFRCENQMTESELFILSRLSFIFALFEHVEIKKQKLLIPISMINTDYINSKISQLLKYSGKTNELFTKMMIHIGLLSSGFNYDQNIQLLDPVAGKGTTLFEGTVYGFDVAGIEINKKSVHESCVFFKKFLEKERYKHKVTKIKGSRKNNLVSPDSQEFIYAASKEDYKNESSKRKLKIVNGDTVNTNRYFKKNSFQMIVGDLPYGIVHGNISKNKQVSPSPCVRIDVASIKN